MLYAANICSRFEHESKRLDAFRCGAHSVEISSSDSSLGVTVPRASRHCPGGCVRPPPCGVVSYATVQSELTKRERWLRTPRFPWHLAFHRADCRASHGNLAIYDAARRWLAELPPPPAEPLCTGRDVLALGIAEGPLVGELLRRLEQRLESEPLPERSRALELLAQIAAPYVKPTS